MNAVVVVGEFSRLDPGTNAADRRGPDSRQGSIPSLQRCGRALRTQNRGPLIETDFRPLGIGPRFDAV